MRHGDHTPRRPPVIGIVGGLAGGKSTVARLLGRKGAAVIDADSLGHRMLRRPEVKEALVEQFGDEILDAGGEVKRARLAEVAFEDPERVRALNAIVHPPVIRQIIAEIEAMTQRDEVPLIVLDAALLVETGLHREHCDALLFVDTPEETRRRRAAQRGMSAGQFDLRTTAQAPPAKKKQLSDFTVENTGSLEELEARLDRLWPELCRVTSPASPPSHSC